MDVEMDSCENTAAAPPREGKTRFRPRRSLARSSHGRTGRRRRSLSSRASDSCCLRRVGKQIRQRDQGLALDAAAERIMILEVWESILKRKPDISSGPSLVCVADGSAQRVHTSGRPLTLLFPFWAIRTHLPRRRSRRDTATPAANCKQ